MCRALKKTVDANFESTKIGAKKLLTQVSIIHLHTWRRWLLAPFLAIDSRYIYLDRPQGDGLIGETRLTMCDLCLTHIMGARNSVFNTMYIAVAMALMTPSNFYKFSMVFSYQKNVFWKSHYFWRGYPYQAITRTHPFFRFPKTSLKKFRFSIF